MKKLLIAALAVVFSVATLWAADAFTGTWKVNPAKSKFDKGKELKEATVVITEQGANTLIEVKGTRGDGSALNIKNSTPTKGGPTTFTAGAPPDGSTVMVKRVDANTTESTNTLKGKEVGSAHTSVSKDGKTMTRVEKGTDDKGKAFSLTIVLDRQ